MVNLRMYISSHIEQAAANLAHQYGDGEISTHEYGRALSDLVFRDSEGSYWACDKSGAWHRYDGAGWEPKQPPERLEGLAEILFGGPPAEAAAPAEPDEEPGAEPDATTRVPPNQGFQELTDMISGMYADGRLSLEDADSLLAQRFLIDRQGYAWNMGARSKDWYVFKLSGWEPAGRSPQEVELMQMVSLPRPCPQCGEKCMAEEQCAHCGAALAPVPTFEDDEARTRFLLFLLKDTVSPPESLSNPWDPPAWYPDAVLANAAVCPECKTENPQASNFCCHCGTVLVMPEPAEEPDAETGSGKKFCTECGAALAPGKKFCTNCGKPAA